MDFPPSNILLARLTPELYEKLSPDLETVPLRRGIVLHEQDRPITHSYFPVSGVISVGMAGSEGMAGLPYVADGLSPWRAVVQADAVCLVIDREKLVAVASANPEFQVLLLRYMGYLHKLASQNIACNRGWSAWLRARGGRIRHRARALAYPPEAPGWTTPVDHRRITA
jgi:hypothetical protein